MKNKIEDLRNHLFETIERMKDEENPMEIARAKAIADVAQTIINSAKVEVDYINATGSLNPSSFIESPDPLPAPRLVNGGRK